MAELKPCPFCGGKAHIKQTQHGTTDRSSVYLGFRIECAKCDTTALKAYGSISINLDNEGQLNIWQDDREKAITTWNRRNKEDE